MVTRVLFALALLASPAAALDIFEDTVITEANAPAPTDDITVHGSASLTIESDGSGEGPWNLGDVTLRDDSSFTMHAGKIKGVIKVLGQNSIAMTGGFIDAPIPIKSWPDSHATIDLSGGYFGSPGRGGILELYEGAHDLTIRGTFTGSYGVGGQEDITFTGYGPRPFYRTGGDVVNFSVNVDLMVRTSVSNSFASWSLHSSDPSRLHADLDGNGDVDLADLNSVRNNFGSIFPQDSLGDTFPLDGRVDLADLNRVRNTFGVSIPQAVPEPTSLILMAMGCSGFAWFLARPRRLQRLLTPQR